MKKTVWKNVAKACVVLCLAICCIVSGAIVSLSVKADSNEKLISDFFTSEDVGVSPNSQFGFSGNESVTGVMLSFDDGASVKLGNTYAGSFSLSHCPVGNGGAYGLRKFTLDFADENGKSFAVTVYQTDEISVSVKTDGVEAGIFYGVDKTPSTLTAFANFHGLYTSVAADKQITLRFDSASMSVYVASGSSEYLVWNMKNSENDGRDIGKTLDSFGKYTVSVTADETVGGEGKILVSSINGYALDGLIFSAPSVPEVSVSAVRKGLVGERYYLPAMAAFDFIDGELEYSVSVTAPDSTECRVTNGYFVPTSAGSYSLNVSAKNSFDKTTKKNFVISVYETVPNFDYSFDEEPIYECYAGERVYIPEMRLTGGLAAAGATEVADVSVYRNGIKIIAASDRKSGFYYDVLGAGTYTLVYDVFGSAEERSFTANDKISSFDYDGPRTVFVGDIADFSDAVFKVNGQSVDFDFTVEFPDGKLYSNKCFIAAAPGVYTATATAEVDEKTYAEQIIIEAYINQVDLFVPGDDYSAADFGHSLFYGKSGIKIDTTMTGSTVVYQREIDISEYVNQSEINSNGVTVITKNATPIIELGVEADTYRSAAMSTLIITLAQADDPTNYVKIILKKEDSRSFTYIQALAGAQGYCGFENSNNPNTNAAASIGSATGNRYTNHYGFYARHTFTGQMQNGYKPQQGILKLYYDNEQKQVLAQPASLQNCVVNDFDNTDICNGTVWEGFTSDKVILTLETGDMLADSASYYVYGIDGTDMTSESFVYGSEPQISVDKEVLYGVKGTEVSLPAARAVDFGGNTITDVITKVFFKTDEDEYYDVNVKDGKFVADREGDYVAAYVAVDCYGQMAVKEIPVTVRAVPALSASVGEVASEYRSGVTGEYTTLLPKELIVVANELGDVDITVSVEGKSEAGKTVAVTEDGKAFFEDAGEYTVTYTVTDGTGREVAASYDVTVTPGTNAEVYGSVPVYKGFIKSRAYEIATLRVKDYSGDVAEIKNADVFIDGEPYSESTYTPSAAGTAEIEYKLGGNTILSYSVPVVELLEEVKTTLPTGVTVTRTVMRMEKLFISEENASSAMAGNSLTFTASGSGYGKTSFINKLSADYVKLEFDIAAQKQQNLSAIDTNIASFDVYLTDALDADKTVKFSYYMNSVDGKAYVSLNDGKRQSIGTRGALDGTSADSFVMLYRRSTGRMYDETGNAILAVDSYLGDGEFESFGEYVYVSFGITRKDASKDAEMKLYSINSQNISSADRDSVAPSIIIENSAEGRYELGSEITVSGAKGYDVLGSVTYCNLTVNHTDFEGNVSVVSGTDGVALGNVPADRSYTLKLDKTGDYEIVYEARDDSGNTAQSRYTVTTFIIQDPVINIASDVPAKAVYGSTVSLPQYSVDYCVENNGNLDYIVVVSPSNRHYLIKEGTFEANEKGLWKVRYVAIDCYGNYVMKEFEIICA